MSDLELMKELIQQIKALNDAQQGPFVTWLIATMVRDVTYYVVIGIVAWALGRRLILATVAAIQESRRERA